MRVYKVDLTIVGPLTIEEPMVFDTEKELTVGDVFKSKISLTPVEQGLWISTTVFTSDADSACRVAILFVGKMLDILSIKTNMPYYVTNKDVKNKFENVTVRPVIDRYELDRCFELSRFLNLNKTTLSRSLTWYRKGLYTEDPFDKFLAFWNSINVVAGKYCEKNELTQRGTVNQIWDCFVRLWGKDKVKKEFEPNGVDLIGEMNDIRNNIAHGLVPVEITYVQNVIDKLNYVQRLAYRFLTEFSEKFLELELL